VNNDKESITPRRVTFEEFRSNRKPKHNECPMCSDLHHGFHANSEYMEYRQEAYMQLVEKIKLMDYKLLNRENELRKIGRNLTTATEVIRFYGEYDNFSKHPDEEYIVETMGLTLKDAQLGYKARKWLGENVEK